jgi:hypothetical protein
VRYLPSWFPGANFKRYSIEWRKLIEDFVNEPYKACKEKIVRFHLQSLVLQITHVACNQKNGTAEPSFCSMVLDKGDDLTPEKEFDLKWTVNSMYTGTALFVQITA